jgi:hypothetical protein
MIRTGYESSSPPEVAAASRRRTRGVLAVIRGYFRKAVAFMMS